MDSKVEDKMVRQIERSLSNNINEDLFLSGGVFEKENKHLAGDSVVNSAAEIAHKSDYHQDNAAVALEYVNQLPTLSRAEYIRQARESCLRQLDAIQSSSRIYDSYFMEEEPQKIEVIHKKKTKAMNLFQDNSDTETLNEDKITAQEIAAFRFLIIRTICAIVLFLSIFIIDKFQFKIGNLTPEVIQEYVTGNDTLQELENIMISWLRE